MATQYIVDPTRFQAEGAFLNWPVVARRLGLANGAGTTLQLRWMLKAEMGLPTEPFIVWRRMRSRGAAAPLTLLRFPLYQYNLQAFSWPQGHMSSVTVVFAQPLVQATTVYAYSGSPTLLNIVAVGQATAGATAVTLNAHAIDGVMVANTLTLNSISGLSSSAYGAGDGWEPIEVVGLPATPSWAAIGGYGKKQGIMTALTDAPHAAVDRLKRGAPPVGWAANIVAGVPAPPWVQPDPTTLVDELIEQMLKPLRQIMGTAPAGQAAATVSVHLPPPETSQGVPMPNSTGTDTDVSPLSVALLGASTDPYVSLALGFGTAYGQEIYAPPSNVLASALRYDFRVTARWEAGLDGKSNPLDFAAVIPSPSQALPPWPPTNLGTETLGILKPFATDGDWRASARVRWDRPAETPLFRNSSIGLVRAGLAPAAASTPLMEKRASGGVRPIVINNNPGDPNDPENPPDPDYAHIHLSDREVPIPAAQGTAMVLYGVAMQDIYGQWSPWAAAPYGVHEPALDALRITAAEVHSTLPNAGALCPATVQVDFTWDWSVRSPDTLTFASSLWPAATHGAPPPSDAVSPGFATKLNDPGSLLVVKFNGDVPNGGPAVTLTALNEAGDTTLPAFGPEQKMHRRYRMVVAGLLLDFGATHFIGMSLWAGGKAQVGGATTDWSAHPVVISAADPRPPVIQTQPVQLGSLPDAGGQSHAQVVFPATAGAAGYFLYEASETALRKAWGMPDPALAATLTDRRSALNAAFTAHAALSRKPFTRYNSSPLPNLPVNGTISADVALPRGSREIHAFVVLGVSPAQVESEWPATADAVYFIAAPHIDTPAPPTLLVQRVKLGNAFKAAVSIETRLGPRVRRIDLHRVRVDDAAKTLDSMGPPVATATIDGAAVGLTITPVNDAKYGTSIGAATASDTPPGSWKRVWYRAVAWSGKDEARGGLPGRSASSNPAWVVIPPDHAPTLSEIAQVGGALAGTLMVEWTVAAPLNKTPLGPHQLTVRATRTQAPSATPPVYSLDATLDSLSHAVPAGAGVWVAFTAAGVSTLRARVPLAAAADPVRLQIVVTDPLGRSTEKLFTAAQSMGTAPNLSALHVTPQPVLHRTLLTFTSSSPIGLSPAGVYTLNVLVRGAGKAVLAQLDLPLSKITGFIPPAFPPRIIWVYRSGAGPLFKYTVSTSAAVVSFTVRITGPDGTFVEQTVAVN